MWMVAAGFEPAAGGEAGSGLAGLFHQFPDVHAGVGWEGGVCAVAESGWGGADVSAWGAGVWAERGGWWLRGRFGGDWGAGSRGGEGCLGFFRAG